MVDLFPSDVMDALHAHFGAKFEALDSNMRLILALASLEETVSHARLITALSAHPVEITRMLQQLCRSEMLVPEGSGKGTVYFLPWQKLPTAEQVFGPNLRSSSVGLVDSSVGLSSSSTGLESSTEGLNIEKDEHGRIVSEHLCLPLIDDLKTLSSEFEDELEKLAKEPREKKRVSRKVMEDALLELCRGHYISLQVLSELVQRNPDFLRADYLSPMVKDKKISMAFPTTPTHERQAYCLTESLQSLEKDEEL